MTASDVGDTNSANFEINMRALQGIWKDIETKNSCDRAVRGYLLEFFDDALNDNYDDALIHLDEAYEYLNQ